MFLEIKIIYLCIIVFVCFIGGIATILLKRFCNSSKNVISYSSCLGGGILLGASFLHLLKDSEEFLIGDYPYSHLLYAFGFFTSFILERVLFEHSHDHEIMVPKSLTTVIVTAGDEEKEELIMSEFEMEEKDNNQDSHSDSHEGHSHNTTKTTTSTTTTSNGKFPYMLFVVLSLESFISGMALTIEEDTILISITFIAIITHIWAEAFALSANIIKSLSISNDSRYISKRVIISSFIFSFITPIGGLFGFISEYILKQNQIDQISGILLAFAGGCFLYVAVFEIMVEEFSSHNHGHSHNSNQNSKSILITKLIKLFLLLSGFGFMAAIAYYV